jgi:hypothetical protein
MKFGLEIMSRLHHYSIPEIVNRAIHDVFSSENEGLSDWNGESGERRFLLDTLWRKLVLEEPKYWSDPTERTDPFLQREVLAQDWDAIEVVAKGPTTK